MNGFFTHTGQMRKAAVAFDMVADSVATARNRLTVDGITRGMRGSGSAARAPLALQRWQSRLDQWVKDEHSHADKIRACASDYEGDDQSNEAKLFTAGEGA